MGSFEKQQNYVDLCLAKAFDIIKVNANDPKLEVSFFQKIYKFGNF